MKRTAIIITSVIILLFGAYLWYDYSFKSSRNVNILEFVPNSAAIVIENNSFSNSWNTLLESSQTASLKAVNGFRGLSDWLSQVDSLSGSQASVDKATRNGVVISHHKVGRNKIDALIFIDLNKEDSQETLYRLLSNLKEQYQYKSVTRVYQGYKIEEIKIQSKKTFSYLIRDNVFIGSFTPFLVEDVIRLINDNYKNGFYSTSPSFATVPKLGTDEGNVYINYNRFDEFLGLFLQDDDPGVNSFATSTYFDFSLQEDLLLFTGFTETHGGDFLNTLRDQKPQKNNFQYYISNECGIFYQIGFDDGLKWYSSLLKFWSEKNDRYLKERDSFAETHSFDFERLYSWLGKGVALSLTPTLSGGPEPLIILDTKDLNEALNHLNSFSESLYLEGDSIYVENFDELTIRELNIEKFPYFAFGPLFKGFDKSFYTALDDYLFFADNIQTLKQLVTDIETENTLGRSVQFSKFNATTLEESNFKIVVNTPRILDVLISESDQEWAEFFIGNRSALDDFKFIGVDFSSLDDNFYTSLSVGHEYSEGGENADKQQYISSANVGLNYPIATKPFVVRSHVDNSRETLLQDSLNYLMLISATGEKLWEKQLDGLISGDVHQIDYYKNGKLQYFFTTQTTMYIIDRLGHMVEDYPKALPLKSTESSVLDYDKSKRYRFLLSDERGNLYLFNKQGINLEGWGPREMEGRLAARPFHLRVRGKDVIVAIQNDGTIDVMNRRGTSMPGFPLKVEGRFESETHVKMGDNLSSTILTIVSKNGLLVTFNLQGEIIGSEQLYRPNQESAFKLVADALGKTYIIARQDFNRLVLINNKGIEFLAKDYLNSGELIVQYYNFSTSNQVYVVTDLEQGFSYVYNVDGQLINSRPVDSDFNVSMMYYESKNTYEIFVASGSTFKRLSF